MRSSSRRHCSSAVGWESTRRISSSGTVSGAARQWRIGSTVSATIESVVVVQQVVRLRDRARERALDREDAVPGVELRDRVRDRAEADERDERLLGEERRRRRGRWLPGGPGYATLSLT